ncbi:hypothetical protein F4678DRAFT_445316, partial [Xylaria arbuscula]
MQSVESIVHCERAVKTIDNGGADFDDALRQLANEAGVASKDGSASDALKLLMRRFQNTNQKLWSLVESLLTLSEV